MAQWKDIAGYEGLYLVSTEGEIYSLPKMKKGNKKDYFQSGMVLKPTKRGRNGVQYELVKLCKNGVQKTVSVHRIVAEAFVENPNNDNVVNHIDRNCLNNKADNLEWCSQQYNNEYSHNKRICQFLINGEKIAEFKSTHFASTLTGINERSISNAACGWSKTAGGYIWKYLDEEEE